MVAYRHSTTKEVVTVSGNSPEGRDLAKDPDWDRCPPSETDDVEILPPGVQDAPTPTPTPPDKDAKS